MSLRGRVVKILNGPGGAVLVLRAFLGITFTFAGLQKLANSSFLTSYGPGSFREQLSGSIATSPLHHLLDPALHAPTFFAILIACGELAVGLGTLFGLLGRVAATAGMLLSLMFFLTVSFNDSPYYYGADIVFLFAWTPIALGGSGPLSLDRVIAARKEWNVEFSRGRRFVLRRSTAIALLAGLGVILGGGVSALGRALAGNTKSNSSATSSGTNGSSTISANDRIAKAITVPVGTGLLFTDRIQNIPAYLVHPTTDGFRAFSAVCTHAGCTVAFDSSTDTFNCPCHGSVFNGRTGAVINGPATRPLPEIDIRIGPDDTIYSTS